MIKFIELTDGPQKVLVQVGDVRMIKPAPTPTMGFGCYLYFTDGTHTCVQETYEYICAMLYKTLT